MADRLIIRGAREHNLRDVNLDLPARRDDRLHRAVRLGQVQPRLRHDLRRGPAPLRRVAVVVRPAVPRPDGQARRRLHRGPAARRSRSTRSRPRATRARPSARSPRSTTTCGCCSPGSASRTARSAASRSPGRRPQQIVDRVLGDGRGHPVPGARAGGARAQGRVRRPLRRAAVQGLRAGPGRRRGAPADRAAQAQEAGEAHDRGGRRPARGQGQRQAAADRLDRDRAAAGRRHRASSTSSTCPRTTRHRERSFSEHLACPNDHPLAIEDLEPRVVLLQLALRRLPRVHRPRHQEGGRPGADRARPGAHPARGRDPAVGRPAQTLEYFLRLLEALGDAEGFDLDTPWRTLPPRAQKAILHGSDDQVHVRYRNKYGRERSYYTGLRGRRAVDRAAALRHRVRLVARPVRGLHARRAVPGVRRRPAQARDARGHDRRPQHRRGLRACRSASAPSSSARWSSTTGRR